MKLDMKRDEIIRVTLDAAKSIGVEVVMVRKGGYTTKSVRQCREILLKANPMETFNPLLKGEQALALQEALKLTVSPGVNGWVAVRKRHGKVVEAKHDIINFAITLCAAKLVSN